VTPPTLFVPSGVTAHDLAVALEIPVTSVIRFLVLHHKVMVTTITPLSDDQVHLLADEFGHPITISAEG
jgi:hypothetical protein